MPQARKPKLWPAVTAYVLLLALLVAGGDLWWKSAHKPPPEPSQVNTRPLNKQQQAVVASGDAFLDALRAHAPKYLQIQRTCPVCGTQFTVPSGENNNQLGGQATDLLSLTLSPPDKVPGPYSLEKQKFDYLLGTCPKCGATYQEMDITNLIGGRPLGGLAALKGWDLGKLAPELAGKPQETWTFDERNFARYLTLRAAGDPESELGYAALAGAYSSNLSVAQGRDYHIPAAAFYALAAAHFARALGSGKVVAKEQPYVELICGELCRLLGRKPDAQKWLGKAKTNLGAAAKTAGAIKAPGIALKVAGELSRYNSQNDMALHRAPVPAEVKAPPVGWYIDRLLPAINAELAAQRRSGEWTAAATPEDLTLRIRQVLAKVNSPIPPAPGK